MKVSTTQKNIFSSLIGNLVFAFGQYLLLILFIKFFSKAEVGMYLFALAFVAPISLAMDLQLRTLYVTENNSKVKFSDYYSYRIITNIVSVIILVIGILVYRNQYFAIVLILTLIRAVESHIDLLYGVYQQKYRLDFVAKSKIIRTVISLVSVFLTVLITENLIYSLYAYLFVWVGLYLLFEKRNVIKKNFLESSDFKFRWDKINLKYLLIQTSPLVFAILVNKYYSNYPRIAIESFLSLGDLAIFGSLLYFKTLASQIISAVGQATTPNLMGFLVKRDYLNFKKLLNKLILFGFSLGILGIVIVYFFGEFTLSLLYSEEYAKYNEVLILILLGAAITFSYIYIGTAITCLRKQWIKLPISALGLILIIALFYAIKPINLMVVAYIILAVETVMFLLYFGTYKLYINNVIQKNFK